MAQEDIGQEDVGNCPKCGRKLLLPLGKMFRESKILYCWYCNEEYPTKSFVTQQRRREAENKL